MLAGALPSPAGAAVGLAVRPLSADLVAVHTASSLIEYPLPSDRLGSALGVRIGKVGVATKVR